MGKPRVLEELRDLRRQGTREDKKTRQEEGIHKTEQEAISPFCTGGKA